MAPERPALVDASAIVALLTAEPAMDLVKAILRRGGAAVATLNLAEAADRLARRRDMTLSEVRTAIAALPGATLAIVDLDEATAWRAAEIRSTHYHRARAPISMADAVLLATAADRFDVASSDRALLAIAVAQGIGVHPLPDSHGRVPDVG